MNCSTFRKGCYWKSNAIACAAGVRSGSMPSLGWRWRAVQQVKVCEGYPHCVEVVGTAVLVVKAVVIVTVFFNFNLVYWCFTSLFN